MNRIFKYTTFGDDGLKDPKGILRPFSGIWIRGDIRISITVWASDWKYAEEWCLVHGLKLDGEIIERIE